MNEVATKWLTAAVASAVLSLAVAGPTPASAAGSCATHAEFKKVKDGMNLAEVRHIFGFHGHQLYKDRNEFAYFWQACGGGDRVARVAFHPKGGAFQKTWGPVR